ncbi:MAG: Nif3-like dinuclear metal center hexameric protein, partial [Spirochaetes bacterium]|nr:Nif3-like dinuclear metal center hexameric protein [Spirochaetota bacterium]
MSLYINEINNFIKDYLSSEAIKDIAINGVQLENDADIKKIAFAVDMSNDLINSAVEKNCNLLIVHHGIFWGSPIPITGTFKNRIKILMENNIGLIAQHLPLDMHPEIGNNAQILKLLQAKE